ncbi:MAG: hypothetical protein WBD40_21260, partial [Tepidisphaeraceae bacterium]
MHAQKPECRNQNDEINVEWLIPNEEDLFVRHLDLVIDSSFWFGHSGLPSPAIPAGNLDARKSLFFAQGDEETLPTLGRCAGCERLTAARPPHDSTRG